MHFAFTYLLTYYKKNAIFGNYFKLLSRPRKLKDLLFLAVSFR